MEAKMRFSRAMIVIAVAMLLVPCVVYANDTIARVGLGGITFPKSDEIAILEEVLTISTTRIRVSYRFRNESDSGIRTTVAFPMPPFYSSAGELYSTGPVTTFKAFVNGQEISTETITRAIINGKDVTEVLLGMGISKKQISDFAGCKWSDKDQEVRSKGLSKEQIDRLREFGEPYPTLDECPWALSDTFYWEQDFPAHQVVSIEHEYAPFVGSMYDVGLDSYINLLEFEPKKKEACYDKKLEEDLRKRLLEFKNREEETIYTFLSDVEYVLGTGRNWRGPIKKFILRIEKDSPDQLISLCLPVNPVRDNSLAYEYIKENFFPQDMLVVHFFKVELR